MFGTLTGPKDRSIASLFPRTLQLGLLAALFAFGLACAPALANDVGCPDKPNVPSSDGTQPPNLGILKLQLTDYKCFGGYDRDVARVLGEAQAYVERRASQVKQPALVLDIDETSLSNWAAIKANDFGFIPHGGCKNPPAAPCGNDSWQRLAAATVIEPTLKLFKAARVNKVAVFFITGRTEDFREATEKNLRNAGYDDWSELMLKPVCDSKTTVQQFKTEIRKEIEKKGYTIIANVGDQYSDLEGGYSERVFKVPDPFYFLP
ncbi:MAG: HAD family acid phosphatase [Alphaproteobacteria bacterium]